MKIKLHFLIIFLYAIGPLQSFAQGTWTQKASMLGNPRYNLLGFPIGENGYIAGGTFGGLTVTSDCQEFDPAANLWIQKAPMPAAFRAGAAFSGGGYGYTTTGVNEAMFIQELYEYNALGNNWSTISSFPGDVRMYASGFNIGRNGYITCGSYINITPLNDLWEYNQLANTWMQKADLPGSARSNATAFTIGSNGYVFGGTDGSIIFNDLWEYDPATDNWTQKTSLPGQGRTDAMAFSIGDYAYIIGGWPGNNTPLSEVWQYNLIADTWTLLPDFPGIPSAGGTAFAINGLGYVVGGYGTTQCWEYDPNGVGIRERSEDQISVYPNPARDHLTITINTSASDKISVKISDLPGRVVINKTMMKPPGRYSISVDLVNILPGFYNLTVFDGKNLRSFKFERVN
jgi:N-acetylneuraminic acid mutarotase